MATEEPALDGGEKSQAASGSGAGSDPDELDRRLVRELSARGVPPDEVARLLALGRTDPARDPKRASEPNPPAIPVLEDERFVLQPTLTLPEPREATAEQKAEADLLLGRARLSYRRGAVQEALALCKDAVELTPGDAVALELYGDILQSLGRVDDALYCYRTAADLAPERASAERRYAELRLLQSRDSALLQSETVPRNALVAALMSALLPGAGQVYNGEPVKGVLIAALALGLALRTPDLRGASPTSGGGDLALWGLFAVALYLYAVVDARLGAARGKRTRAKSGWDV